MAVNEMEIGDLLPEELKSLKLNEKAEAAEQQNPVDIIKADHKKVDGLFKQFEKTEDKKQKFEIANQICMELTVHAQYEEELVYPIVAKVDDDGEQEAELEHELVKYMIGEIQKTNARDKSLEPKVKVLKELVQHHVKEEESEILPEIADNEELLGRTQEILDRKQQLMDRLMKKSGTKKSASSRSSAKTTDAKSSGRKVTAAKSSGRSSTNAKKAEGGRKGGTTKKAASSKTTTKKAASSKVASKTNSKKTGSSKAASSTKRGAAGNKKLAAKGGRGSRK